MNRDQDLISSPNPVELPLIRISYNVSVTKMLKCASWEEFVKTHNDLERACGIKIYIFNQK